MKTIDAIDKELKEAPEGTSYIVMVREPEANGVSLFTTKGTLGRLIEMLLTYSDNEPSFKALIMGTNAILNLMSAVTAKGQKSPKEEKTTK